MALLDDRQIIQRLRKACVEAGSQKAFAKKHGVTPQQISDIMRGQVKVSQSIARALGCNRRTVYEELQ